MENVGFTKASSQRLLCKTSEQMTQVRFKFNVLVTRKGRQREARAAIRQLAHPSRLSRFLVTLIRALFIHVGTFSIV